MKQPLDTAFDNITPMSGSIPSPAASQMSNMSNPTKFIKLIGGRDRGRKAKALKVLLGVSQRILCLIFSLIFETIYSRNLSVYSSLQISAGQPGSGSPWSLFEDQVALPPWL